MKAFEKNIVYHQSLGTPIVTMPSSIKAYTICSWNKTNVCNNSPSGAISCARQDDNRRRGQNDNRLGTSNYTCTDAASCTAAGDTHTPATLKGKARPSLAQRQKNQCRAVMNDATKHKTQRWKCSGSLTPRWNSARSYPVICPRKFVCLSAAWGKNVRGRVRRHAPLSTLALQLTSNSRLSR